LRSTPDKLVRGPLASPGKIYQSMTALENWRGLRSTLDKLLRGPQTSLGECVIAIRRSYTHPLDIMGLLLYEDQVHPLQGE
jgi:hypothetical protein